MWPQSQAPPQEPPLDGSQQPEHDTQGVPPLQSPKTRLRRLLEKIASWERREVYSIEHELSRDALPVVRIFRWLASRHFMVYLTALGAVLFLALATLGFWLQPHQINFAFSSSANCTFAPALLPAAYAREKRGGFTIRRPGLVRVAGVDLLATSLCIEPIQPLKQNATYVVHQPLVIFGLPLGAQITVKTAAYAQASAAPTETAALPLAESLRFNLTAPDATFDYLLTVGDQRSSCLKQSSVLNCPLMPLRLNYGASYNLRLVRSFGGKQVDVVTNLAVTTITAAAITGSSIAEGSTIYDSPTNLVLTANKPLKSAGALSLTAQQGDKTTAIPVTLTKSGSQLTVLFGAALPRRATINLRLAQLTATDGSQLEQAYGLDFTTSGGPKVTGINISSSGVSLRPSVVVYFDQPLLVSQAASSLATLTANSAAVPVRVAISGSQLSLTPTADLPRCAALTVSTTNGVMSQYGFSGDSAWSYSSRSLCYTTFSIGTSVQGRSITAYRFGSGSSLILYIGAMHGTESNTARLLNRWIDDLDAYPDRIPTGRVIVVIPQINPDGVAANTRVNAHTVDLNRNFPADDWQTQVTLPGGGGVVTNDGGPAPLSEPESQAIASYVQAQRPRLTLDYHSNASLVQGDGIGDADQLGFNYAAKAGYWGVSSTYTGTLFDYTTTGSFEGWLHDKLALPEMIIELRTSYSDEFSANRSAMWVTAQL